VSLVDGLGGEEESLGRHFFSLRGDALLPANSTRKIQ
jgi:hypothetical protein